MALLEAMDASVPVMATDVGECREVLEDGACGIILPPEPEAWAQAMDTTIDALRGHLDGSRVQGEVTSAALLKERVRRARERAADRYSLSTTLESYERLYATR